MLCTQLLKKLDIYQKTPVFLLLYQNTLQKYIQISSLQLKISFTKVSVTW